MVGPRTYQGYSMEKFGKIVEFSLSGLSLFLWLYSSPKSRIKVMLLIWEWIRVAMASRR